MVELFALTKRSVTCVNSEKVRRNDSEPSGAGGARNADDEEAERGAPNRLAELSCTGAEDCWLRVTCTLARLLKPVHSIVRKIFEVLQTEDRETKSRTIDERVAVIVDDVSFVRDHLLGDRDAGSLLNLRLHLGQRLTAGHEEIEKHVIIRG